MSKVDVKVKFKLKEYCQHGKTQLIKTDDAYVGGTWSESEYFEDKRAFNNWHLKLLSWVSSTLYKQLCTCLNILF